jgi:hypothetical protein
LKPFVANDVDQNERLYYENNDNSDVDYSDVDTVDDFDRYYEVKKEPVIITTTNVVLESGG